MACHNRMGHRSDFVPEFPMITPRVEKTLIDESNHDQSHYPAGKNGGKQEPQN